MKVERLLEIIGADFYAGIPDSLLKPLCNYLMNIYGIDIKHHIIAANEGNCVALAAGYHLATGKIPVVYMQNSGEGNAINPIVSLLNDNVYAIPIIFIIGWRGEPGKKDEPQHIYQGKITVRLLEDMDIETFVLGAESTERKILSVMERFRKILGKGKSVAFVVCKDALTYNDSLRYNNSNSMVREEIIRHIVEVSGDDPIIATTGKISRELFEVREEKGQNHKYDFLTVGSMGHASSIAMGIAVNKPNAKLWCIEGDGAVLMHMGAMAVIGTNAPENMVHIIINNEAHETVGGMPTVAGKVDFMSIAKACGYPNAVCVDNYYDLDRELNTAKEKRKLSLIEVKCAVGSRCDLGRPTIAALENKYNFINYIANL